jgi:two-component system, OmpR family, KDP operon response regulator KdpE
MGKLANTILVIDDESQIRRFISVGLALHGYRVCEAANGGLGLSIFAENPADVVILDLGLPDMGGFEVLQTIRSWSHVPVIVLSIEAGEELKVQLLKSGADDYMIKPFGIAELAARCEVILRRYHTTVEKASVARIGPLAVDFASRAVTLEGHHVKLTRNEYKLLYQLASHLGLVVTHSQLIKDLWGDSEPNNVTQYLRTLVRSLRQKLEADPSQPKLLISEFGVGYRLGSVDAAAAFTGPGKLADAMQDHG